jgi:hypothetical protein
VLLPLPSEMWSLSLVLVSSVHHSHRRGAAHHAFEGCRTSSIAGST